jgi:hypothetical protein
MLVTYSVCDKDKKIITTYPNNVCFSTLPDLVKSAQPVLGETYYINYKPRYYQKGTEEQRREFFKFLSSIWFFPEILDGQTYDDVLSEGVYINISKWDAWRTFNTLSMVRYMDEFDGCQVIWDKLCKENPKATPFQIFIAMHWFDNNWNLNSNHTFLSSYPIRVIDDLKQEDFNQHFPDYGGKSCVEYSCYLSLPNGHHIGITPIFDKTIEKFPKSNIPVKWECPVLRTFQAAKHYIMPRTFGPPLPVKVNDKTKTATISMG